MKKIKVSPSVPNKLEVENVKENHMRLHIYPFESGYGISIAHPLRRLLLSSTAGYAPVGIKIEGVKHEFDSVRGMLEDVAEFIINLKTIRFKLVDDKESATLTYSFKGPKELYGKDFENEQVEVVTPNNFLATLNEDATLNLTILIKKGIGYVPSEEIREELPEGFIPLDAFFTPVKKAVYEIENMLVEDNPHYEKVVFDIQTDGQVEPTQALQTALEVMKNQMAIFYEVLDEESSSGNGKGESELEKVFFEKIDSLGLSARSYNSLERAGIEYVGELLLKDKNELKSIKNLGKKSLDEIEEKLSELPINPNDLTPQIKEEILKKIETLKG
ncbi:MAG: DNA-directed RNA polymerase subunit alpha [Epsilonproteobacteria bacterium]|nr:DNA-directed RNA polymerase subunit alpha [Campylobacterota bacterium]